MSSFIKKFEIRWGDLDANRHVANVTYAALMNDTRMRFLESHGFNQQAFAKHQIGPVIFAEEFYYVKEVLGGEIVFVDVELLGNSEDFKFIRFCHCLYKENGELAVYSELLFSWMNLAERKLTAPPQAIIDIMGLMKKADAYRILSKEETRISKIPAGKTLHINV